MVLENGCHQEEAERIRKNYVYRGYDNVKALIDFYQKLALYCSQLEENKFSASTIISILNETYTHYYLSFKDILLPIYLGLLLMLGGEESGPEPLTLRVLEWM